MSEISDILAKLPDISFIENMTLEQLQAEMLADYQNKYEELTGKKLSLSKADPMRLLIFACGVQLYQDAVYIDRAGKQSFLKYSYGNFLDNLAALKGIERQAAKPATVTMKFSLQEARKSAAGIPAGTRVTNAYEIYFQTDMYMEIPAGEFSVEVPCTCLTEGTVGNQLGIGEIDILVDPIPYIASVINTTESSGGTEIEDDVSLAERTYLAPANYSCAGSEPAYEYYVKTFSPDIEDVKITSPEECEIDIRFLMAGGELPNEELVQRMTDYINDSRVKPMTDRITIKIPDVEEYEISMKYYINRSDNSSATTIQSRVNVAIQQYIIWQRSKIGRDINPSKLAELCMAAGAKRVEITSPVFKAVPDTSVARLSTQVVTYGGIEND